MSNRVGSSPTWGTMEETIKIDKHVKMLAERFTEKFKDFLDPNFEFILGFQNVDDSYAIHAAILPKEKGGKMYTYRHIMKGTSEITMAHFEKAMFNFLFGVIMVHTSPSEELGNLKDFLKK